ncbi:MAG: phosphatidate cytidylyltransferase [Victivallales bacterium]|nr:phosphatidate cytidylyltransferase [Victivallales bacterium]
MLKERLKTAIPLIVIFLLAFFLPAPWDKLIFTLICIVGLGLAFQEAFAMMNVAHGKAFLWLSWIFGTLLICSTSFSGISSTLGILITTGFLLAAACVVFKHGPTIQNVDALLVSIGIFFYLAWTLSFIPGLYFFRDYYKPLNADAPQLFTTGKRLLLFLIVVTKLADVGAYAFGSMTAKLPGGNHKLSRLVSPKKSWEGLLGGILFASVGSVILYFLGLPGEWQFTLTGSEQIKQALAELPKMPTLPVLPLWACVGMGAVAAVVGLLGDLLESCLKRAANFKDSGKIPGIGGMLDVLDSIIPMAPLFYVVVCFSETYFHNYFMHTMIGH